MNKKTNLFLPLVILSVCTCVITGCGGTSDGMTGSSGHSGHSGRSNDDSYEGESLEEKDFFRSDNFDLDYKHMPIWNALEDIDESSVSVSGEDVYFSTTGPGGEKIRFWGKGIDVSGDGIVVHPAGFVTSLDSVGRVYDVKPVVSEPGDPGNWLNVFGSYDIDLNMHPGNADHMIFTTTFGRCSEDYMMDPRKYPGYEFVCLQPNFFGIGEFSPADKEPYAVNQDDILVSDVYVWYEEEDKATEFAKLIFDSDFYGSYLVGEAYDKDREVYDEQKGLFTFYLVGIPELKGEIEHPTDKELLYYMSYGYSDFFCNIAETGLAEPRGIVDASGNMRDREDTPLNEGDTLSVLLGAKDYNVQLDIVPQMTTARNLHEAVPYAYPVSVGELKALAIPIAWQDEPENAGDDEMAFYREMFGRVIDDNGTVTDYSKERNDGLFSVSEYFDEASYGRVNVSTYITDWYPAPYTFEEYRYQNVSPEFFDEVLDWLYSTYPDMDFSSFDNDDNGYFDAVVFINSGSIDPDGYARISFEGGICYMTTYGKEYAGTVDKPRINQAVNIHSDRCKDNALIHEFSHVFGLIDYYDVRDTGIAALGGYDMQDSNCGDWNAYSKYSVGWIDPDVITGLNKGESVEAEIGVMGQTGDAIVIPAAGREDSGPFGEYILVDLFADCGLNKYAAHVEPYDFGSQPGVRIYHVDSRLEYRDFVPALYPNAESTPIGTMHFANSYQKRGYYLIELIQAGGVNYFTDLDNYLYERKRVTDEDFFKAGDVFTTAKYSEFFYDGLFDNGDDFGYTIEVVSITGSGKDAKAKIRITRQ